MISNRLNDHKNDKSWWAEVVTIKLTHFDTKVNIFPIEREAIKNEKPLYNVTHARRRDRTQVPEGLPDVSAYTLDKVVTGLAQLGVAISKPYLSQLYSGQRSNPSNEIIMALKEFSQGKIRESKIIL